ncbi:MAG: hypothetical protein DLM52_02365 [Chthoniobacterales bacterium]|nr:MAG: hypothetical protein DLM52_02365 [Chthoniobacterales bacterium]
MDESSRMIAAESAVSAVLKPPRRRFFSRREKGIPPALTNCENCGAALTGRFCAECGQHAVDYRRSVWRVLVDAADSFLNWDTKFLSTIGVLLSRPWKLTNDFNAGRRVRYVHPLRLYLLASIAFFLLAKLVHFNAANAIRFDPKDRAELQSALARLAAPSSGLSEEERAKIEAARARLAQGTGTTKEEDRAQLRSALSLLIRESMKEKLKPEDRAKIDAALERVRQAAPANEPQQTGTPSVAPSASASPPAASSGEKNVRHLEFPETMNALGREGEKRSGTEIWIESRIKDKIGEDGTKSQLFVETLRSNVPTMMLCCIPVFAFILKVLYLRQRRFYVEHLIYALHIHTFAYVAVVVTTLLAMGAARWLPGARGWIIGLLATAAVVQIFLSIRRVYRQGWVFSTFKLLLGAVAYLVILVVATGATAFITLIV